MVETETAVGKYLIFINNIKDDDLYSEGRSVPLDSANHCGNFEPESTRSGFFHSAFSFYVRVAKICLHINILVFIREERG